MMILNIKDGVLGTLLEINWSPRSVFASSIGMSELHRQFYGQRRKYKQIFK